MARKQVGEAAGVDDIASALGSRYHALTPERDDPERQPTPQKTTRRSWLLPVDVATEFAAAADRIHHSSGGAVLKSQAQAAIIRAGLAHLDEIDRYLPAD